MKVEFDDYIDKMNLSDLLTELTQACYLNETKDPKKFIALHCSPELLDEKKKYKNKYRRAKEVKELLKMQVNDLQSEVAVLKKDLEELRKQ